LFLDVAIFYPRNFEAECVIAAMATIAMMFALNRSRVYAIWPYGVLAVAAWFFLHSAGIHGALAGIVLAAFLPTRPAPAAGPLLAQAATALAALEHAESELEVGEDNPVFEWASRNLSAASGRPQRLVVNRSCHSSPPSRELENRCRHLRVMQNCA
jgi:NhaA family Na+:H+ antiporter